MILKTLTFTAYGIPQPKGSTRPFVPKGWTHAIVTSANPKNKGWQQVVAESASASLQQQKWVFVSDRPVKLTVVFWLPRPKSIKSKIVPHIKKPDLDKLVRSVKDALTGVIWSDDSLVNEIVATKRYALPGTVPGVLVGVEVIELGSATGEDTLDSREGPRARRGEKPGNFPPIQLQDQRSAPEWTCRTCGGDLLFCKCVNKG